MAFPTVSDTDTQSNAVSSLLSSWTVTYPTNLATGDLIIVFLATSLSNATSLSATGFTTAIRYGLVSSNITIGVLTRISDGTETGTFSVTWSGSGRGPWRAIRIPAATWYGGSLAAGTSANVSDGISIACAVGTSLTPDPPTRTPAWGADDTLWIAWAGAGIGTFSGTWSAFPSGYTDTNSRAAATAVYGEGFATKNANASSEDPGSFTLTLTSGSGTPLWRAATVAIRPAAAAVVTGSATADAVLKKTISSSFTANAVFKKAASSSFTADAIEKRTGVSSASGDAVLFKTQTPSATANAVLFRTRTGSATADAELQQGLVTGSFTADGILRSTSSLTYTGSAVLRSTSTSTWASDALLARTVSGSASANAVTKRNQTGSITANAVLHSTSGSITADAYISIPITNERWQHHRLRDHFGYESDLYTVLSTRIGPWEEGTPVHFVIEDLLTRMAALEGSTHKVFSFTSDSVLLGPGAVVSSSGTARGIYFADAIKKKTQSGSFTASAFLDHKGSFTANAWIRFKGSFTCNAILV